MIYHIMCIFVTLCEDVLLGRIYSISSLSLALLLISNLFGNARVHQVSSQITNSSSAPTNSMQSVGPPHKVIIPFYSQQPTTLSDGKKHPPHPYVYCRSSGYRHSDCSRDIVS